MVRLGQWKYIFHTGRSDLDLGYAMGEGPSGMFHRLYNVEADPGEQQSLRTILISRIASSPYSFGSVIFSGLPIQKPVIVHLNLIFWDNWSGFVNRGM